MVSFKTCPKITPAYPTRGIHTPLYPPLNNHAVINNNLPAINRPSKQRRLCD